MNRSHDSDLPPGRLRRARYLLAGRIHPRDAHPLEIAWVTRHVLTHPSLEADAWQRSREDQALAELRISFGDWPRAHLGEAVLRSLAAPTASDECLRCRANAIASARGLHRPGWSEAVVALIGPGCARCRRSAESSPRPAGVGDPSGTARPVPSTRLRRSHYAAMMAAVPPDPPPGVWQLIRESMSRNLGDGLTLPSISDGPVHPDLR